MKSADQQEVMMSPQRPRVNPRFDWAKEKQWQRLNPTECVFDPSSLVLEFGVKWLIDPEESLRVFDLSVAASR